MPGTLLGMEMSSELSHPCTFAAKILVEEAEYQQMNILPGNNKCYEEIQCRVREEKVIGQ